jgi:hypothetical protein
LQGRGRGEHGPELHELVRVSGRRGRKEVSDGKHSQRWKRTGKRGESDEKLTADRAEVERRAEHHQRVGGDGTWSGGGAVTIGRRLGHKSKKGRMGELEGELTGRRRACSERLGKDRSGQISVAKELDEILDSLQIRALQHAGLDEDGEGDEAQLLELSDGDSFAPGSGVTVRLRRRWSSASFNNERTIGRRVVAAREGGDGLGFAGD